MSDENLLPRKIWTEKDGENVKEIGSEIKANCMLSENTDNRQGESDINTARAWVIELRRSEKENRIKHQDLKQKEKEINDLTEGNTKNYTLNKRGPLIKSSQRQSGIAWKLYRQEAE